MKKYVLAAVLALAGLTAANGASAKTLNIALDGFCNTFSLTTDTFGIYGSRSGCGYTVVDGGSVAKVAGGKYNVTNDSNDAAEIFTWYFSPAVGGVGSFYLYEETPTSFGLVTSGTYHTTKAAVLKSTGQDVTSKHVRKASRELPFNP